MKNQLPHSPTAHTDRAQSFILRVWQPPATLKMRVTIHNTQTGQQHHFANLPQAIEWLTQIALIN